MGLRLLARALASGWFVLLCFALFLALYSFLLPYTVDDAAIYWRIGGHLASFGRYSYNLAGNPFDPSSGTLYVLLAALFAGLHLPPLAASKIVGLSLVLVFAWRAWTVTKRGGAARWPWFSAVLVLLSPFAMIHAVSGLETLLFAWLLFETIVASSGSGPRPALAVSATLLALTRWEGFLFAGAAVAARALCGEDERPRAWLGAGAALAAATAALVAWRAWYFGDPLPLSFYFKAENFTGASRAHNLFWYFAERAEWLAALGILFAVARHATIRQLLFHGWWMAAALAVLAAYSQGALEMNFADRFAFQIFLPFIAFLATRVDWARLSGGLSLAAAVALLWYPHHQPQRAEMKELARERTHREFLAAVGTLMKPWQSCGYTVALDIAGAVPNYSGWEVLDYHGLAEPRIAKNRQSAQQVLEEAIHIGRVHLLITSVRADSVPVVANALRLVRQDDAWHELGQAEDTRFFLRHDPRLAPLEHRLRSLLATAQRSELRPARLTAMRPCGRFEEQCNRFRHEPEARCESELVRQ